MLNEQYITKILTDLNLVLYYRGSHKENPSYNLVSIVESNLALFLKKMIVRKLSYIVTEAVQNIERYSAEGDSSGDFSLIFSDENTFHVITQNLIENKNIDNLKKRLETINSKHTEELNQFYLDCLKSEDFTDKGAGLGLIDLARKSKNTLTYEFNRLSDEYSSYRLHIKLPVDEEKLSPRNENIHSDLISLFDGAFKKNKSTLFYSGDFSNSFLHALLDMVKTVKKSEKLSGDSKFHHILIELTQNIKRHGITVNNKKPGYLCIEWAQENVVISSYNFIDEETKVHLHQKIDSYNNSSDTELKALSQKFLSDFSIAGGLGLIDVALLCRPNKITYDTAKNAKLGSCFYIQVNINYE